MHACMHAVVRVMHICVRIAIYSYYNIAIIITIMVCLSTRMYSVHRGLKLSRALYIASLLNITFSYFLPTVFDMTRPKRWYLDGSEEENGLILCNSDGPYKKPNASAPLGIVLMVSVATEENKGRFSKEEAVLVSEINSYIAS